MTMAYTDDDKLFAACGSKIMCLDIAPEAVAAAKAGAAAAGTQVQSADAGIAEIAVLGADDVGTCTARRPRPPGLAPHTDTKRGNIDQLRISRII